MLLTIYLLQRSVVISPPIETSVGVVGNGEAPDGLWIQDDDVVKLSDFVVSRLGGIVVTNLVA